MPLDTTKLKKTSVSIYYLNINKNIYLNITKTTKNRKFSIIFRTNTIK
jgi:hypothetical protein